ncbi:MAG TPA: ABC transporter permease [Spirochaetia bacterium]|nr:ABC transporter permease [Spirochaetia bacterium]
MYLRYAIRRILNAAAIFIIEMIIFSILFTATAEQTLRAQIEETVQRESARLDKANAEQVRAFMAERRAYLTRIYRLDRPRFERVLWRALDTAAFRFGNSITIKSSRGERDVWLIILETLPRTVLLFTLSIVLEAGLGIWLGVKQARRPGRALDRSSSVITMIVYGLPSWWVAMLAIMFLAYRLPLFPSGGMHSLPPPQGLAAALDLAWHAALPLAVLVAVNFWGVALLSRNIVLGILQEDYITAARARGLPERTVLFGHAMRSAAPPLATIALLSLLSSVFGNIVFEGIFSWPGIGNLYWISVQQGDTAVTLGLLAVTTALYVAGLAALDLMYGLLDPRIRREASR